VSVEQQTDIGPNPRTGRKIDISAAAAERFGYTPHNFPTDSVFYWRQIETPADIRNLDRKTQAIRYRDSRKKRRSKDSRKRQSKDSRKRRSKQTAKRSAGTR
jgi:hypothetical protein